MDLSLVEVLLVVAKVVLVVLVFMHVAVFLTWADRRQGAMIQDRIGPNRAVIWLPTHMAQGLLLAPALLVAAGIFYVAKQADVASPNRTQCAMLFSQLAIFFSWFTALVIAGRVSQRGPRNKFELSLQAIGDPRRIFYIGLFAHLCVLLVGTALRGTTFGLTLREIGYGGGAALLGAAILGGAAYAAYSIRKEPRVGLRLIGLLHAAADGLKTIFKEDIIPPGADRFLHSLAPIISFFPALVVFAVIPFGDTLCFGTNQAGHVAIAELASTVPHERMIVDATTHAQTACQAGLAAVPLQVVNLNVGLLFFFALAGTGIVGAALAGWASDNKFSLLGGLRAASQMVSYEVTMGLTLVGAIMLYGSLRLDDMVRWQAENAWGIFVQPLAFFLFFAAAVAESKRIPFDLPEGESEIVAGYFTEYAGMKFAMFFFSEYIAVVSSSALLTTIFLGGWHLPFVERDGISMVLGDTVLVPHVALSHGLIVVIGVLAFLFKVIALCWLQLMIRWTLPRFRYDQLMRLGWRKLLPLSLLNILATGLIVMAVQAAGAKLAPVLALLGNLSMLLLALAGGAGFVYLIVFLLRPREKIRVLATTSAQYSAQIGGTRSARMGA
ncbi:MAG TPA: complex I subunit 1 family protein [Polyangiaceae bacterium]|nr:complex I subunit 1 family protein [Polyangiaceae bacterium]